MNDNAEFDRETQIASCLFASGNDDIERLFTITDDEKPAGETESLVGLDRQFERDSSRYVRLNSRQTLLIHARRAIKK